MCLINKVHKLSNLLPSYCSALRNLSKIRFYRCILNLPWLSLAYFQKLVLGVFLPKTKESFFYRVLTALNMFKWNPPVPETNLMKPVYHIYYMAYNFLSGDGLHIFLFVCSRYVGRWMNKMIERTLGSRKSWQHG